MELRDGFTLVVAHPMVITVLKVHPTTVWTPTGVNDSFTPCGDVVISLATSFCHGGKQDSIGQFGQPVRGMKTALQKQGFPQPPPRGLEPLSPG